MTIYDLLSWLTSSLVYKFVEIDLVKGEISQDRVDEVALGRSRPKTATPLVLGVDDQYLVFEPVDKFGD